LPKRHTSCGNLTAQNCRTYPGSLSLPSRYTLPAEDSSITPNLEIEGIEKKEGKSQTELKLLSENHLKKKYPLEEWVHVFTDGSHDNGSNSGYGLHCIFYEESHATEPGLSTFDAKAKAIVRAVERIAETANFPLRTTKFVILTDSKAAIQSITKAQNCDELSLSFKQNLVMMIMQQKQLQLQWMISHYKILGIENVDALAKLRSKK